jgi:hypothetical protein
MRTILNRHEGLCSEQEDDHMELKLFGPGGSPDNHFEKGLRALFTLDEAAWEMITKWFSTTDNFEADAESSYPAIAAGPLNPDQFIDSVDALKYILESWHMYDLQLPEIQRDLMLLNYSREQIDRLGTLLEGLGPLKDRVYAQYMRFDHENAVLPTFEGIDAVCDIRPVFEDTVYPVPKIRTVHHTKLLEFTYMVLAEILTEDFHGRTHRLAFQMSESALGDLQAALQRVSEQLDILKASTRAISTQQ